MLTLYRLAARLPRWVLTLARPLEWLDHGPDPTPPTQEELARAEAKRERERRYEGRWSRGPLMAPKDGPAPWWVEE